METSCLALSTVAGMDTRAGLFPMYARTIAFRKSQSAINMRSSTMNRGSFRMLPQRACPVRLICTYYDSFPSHFVIAHISFQCLPDRLSRALLQKGNLNSSQQTLRGRCGPDVALSTSKRCRARTTAAFRKSGSAVTWRPPCRPPGPRSHNIARWRSRRCTAHSSYQPPQTKESDDDNMRRSGPTSCITLVRSHSDRRRIARRAIHSCRL